MKSWGPHLEVRFSFRMVNSSKMTSSSLALSDIAIDFQDGGQNESAKAG